jgi:hypothetical protein
VPEFDEVADFVLKATPRPLLALYGALTELDYPINDKAAFDEAIEGRIGAETLDAEMGRIFRLVFSPGDFPLATTQNALEKFNLRLPPGLRITRAENQLAPPRRPEDFAPQEPAPEEPDLELPDFRELHPPIDLTWTPPNVLEDLERRYHCMRRCRASYVSCIRASRGDPWRAMACGIWWGMCEQRCWRDR